MEVKIIRKTIKPVCQFTEHFKNFENAEAVQQIFGDRTADVLANLEVEFTADIEYMAVDDYGRLLVNPKYFQTGNFTDIYLDVIHELVHVDQVLKGKDWNHALPYVERPLEIEAYGTAVNEARAIGLDENRIIKYLNSDLISKQELRKLATTLQVNYGEGLVLEGND